MAFTGLPLLNIASPRLSEDLWAHTASKRPASLLLLLPLALSCCVCMCVCVRGVLLCCVHVWM